MSAVEVGEGGVESDVKIEPGGEDAVEAAADEGLALGVGVVGVAEGVEVVVVAVAHFGEQLSLPLVAHHTPAGLGKGLLFLGVLSGDGLRIERHGAGELVHAAHVVDFGRQGVAFGDGIEEVAVGGEHPHGGMFAALDGGAVVVGGGVVESEGIVAVGAEEIDEEAALEAAVPALLPEEGWGQIAEGAAFDAGLQLDALAGPEGGLCRFHIEDVACCQRARREEGGLLLPLAEADVGGVAEGVASEVDLAVLGVVDGDAVDGDGRELATESAGGDGLHAAHAAVVLELHAGKVAQGIGHAVAAQPLKAAAVECLGRYHLLIGPLGIHGDIAQVLHRVEAHVAGLGFGLSHRGKAATAQQACK